MVLFSWYHPNWTFRHILECLTAKYKYIQIQQRFSLRKEWVALFRWGGELAPGGGVYVSWDLIHEWRKKRVWNWKVDQVSGNSVSITVHVCAGQPGAHFMTKFSVYRSISDTLFKRIIMQVQAMGRRFLCRVGELTLHEELDNQGEPQLVEEVWARYEDAPWSAPFSGIRHVPLYRDSRTFPGPTGEIISQSWLGNIWESTRRS